MPFKDLGSLKCVKEIKVTIVVVIIIMFPTDGWMKNEDRYMTDFIEW